MKTIRLVAMILFLGVVCAYADFSYEQATRVTGGVAAGAMKVMSVFSKKASEPTRTSVLVKGDRMANIGADQVQVIDLAKETITEIHLKNKTYSVITFAEMKQAMERMIQKASEGKGQDADLNFKVDIKDTGERKSINGLDTRQVILTLEMEGKNQKSDSEGSLVVTSDMWMAPSVPGYAEVRQFHLRMAEKMAWTPGSRGMFQGNSDMARALAGLQKEAVKLEGIAVVQITKIGGAATGQPDQPQPEAEASKSEESSKPSVGGAIGRLGGLGGFGRKKKQPEPEQNAPQAAPQRGAASLIEMTTESSGFSTASIDVSRFDVPAGFRQVESEMVKELRK